MPARIIGTGSRLPLRAVSNKELEKWVDTTDEWIRERTGIEERHLAVEETTASMAVDAARAAMEDAGVADGEEFAEHAASIFRIMKPFNDYLNKALVNFRMPERKK